MSPSQLFKAFKFIWPFLKALFFNEVGTKRERARQRIIFALIIMIGLATLTDLHVRLPRLLDKNSDVIINERRVRWYDQENRDPIMEYMERNLDTHYREINILHYKLEETLKRIEETHQLNLDLRDSIEELRQEVDDISKRVSETNNPRELYKTLRDNSKGDEQ